MRRLVPFLLALILGLAAAGHGALRLSVAAAMPVVLCTGEGAVPVMLDRNGNPLPAAQHHCPDCLPLMATEPPPAAAPASPQRRAGAVPPLPAASFSIARLLPLPPARGPPGFPVV